MTPYAVQGSKVITYDDERSIAEKVNVYISDIALETVLRFGMHYCYSQFSWKWFSYVFTVVSSKTLIEGYV